MSQIQTVEPHFPYGRGSEREKTWQSLPSRFRGTNGDGETIRRTGILDNLISDLVVGGKSE